MPGRDAAECNAPDALFEAFQHGSSLLREGGIGGINRLAVNPAISRVYAGVLPRVSMTASVTPAARSDGRWSMRLVSAALPILVRHSPSMRTGKTCPVASLMPRNLPAISRYRGLPARSEGGL